MSQVVIKKVPDGKRTLPVFDEVARRLKQVEERAFELFKQRGFETGHELEDWFRAERELAWPAAELSETDHTYRMQITLPGFEPKDIEVTVTPKELIIHAATHEQKKTKKDNVLWTEFGSNEVYRRFELPNPINVEKVTAKLEKGILHVTAPETAKAKKAKSAAA